MAKERRDSKNRILGKGEYQKEDGRYMYRYKDMNGKTAYVYSWTLTSTDRTPKGKSHGPCLRDLERSIAADLLDKIDTGKAKQETLNDCFEKYMKMKRRLKPTTRRNYTYNYDRFVRNSIGNMKIADIKYSDIKRFYSSIIMDEGKSIKQVMNMNVFLSPVFKMAVKDNLIRSNPATEVIKELKDEWGYEAADKKALTIAEQEAFIKFVRESNCYKKWYPLFILLLGTGCRIGEACGLTWSDCDFKNKVIRINKNLSYYPEEGTGKYVWRVLKPKSKSSIREVPMFEEVKSALQQERVRQMKEGFNTSVVDGVSGFVFCSSGNTVLMPANINGVILRIVDAYNKKETTDAIKEHREALYLPDFSPHTFRHTFCTRLCENETNLKMIQEIMGHSNFNITMDIYNNISQNTKMRSFKNLEGKMKIC